MHSVARRGAGYHERTRAAYPAGVLSDKGSRLLVLAVGLLVLVAAYVVLAFAPGIPVVAAGVALWNVFGPKGTFLAGAAFAVIALCGLVAMRAEGHACGSDAGEGMIGRGG